MPAILRRLFSRKTLVRFAFAVLAVATLLLIFITFENWRGRKAWEAYRTAAVARGEKLFLKDYVAADIPDSENYAAAPIIRAMFVKPKDGTNTVNPLALPTGKQPKAADIPAGRRISLAEWQTFFLEAKLLPKKSGSAARDILRALEKYEPELQQLRDVSARPRCKFPTRWEDGFATALPHLSPLRAAGILFSLRMSAHLALGESAAAYGEFRHAMRLRGALEAEPSLIAGLVRIAILSRVETAVWDGLAGGQWAVPELLALEKDFAGLRLLDDFCFAISTERGGINQELQRLTRGGAGETAQLIFLAGNSDGPVPTPFADRLFFMVYPKGWLFQNMVRANEYFDAMLIPFRKAGGVGSIEVVPPGQSCDEWLHALGARSGAKRLYYVFINLMLPALDSVQSSYLAAHTQAQQTRLGCVIERFRRARGNFPEKLDELVPEFIASVPEDVCDGNPLRYRRLADGGYDQWSIGVDRKDDGGKTEPDKSLRQQPDWVWHMPGRQ